MLSEPEGFSEFVRARSGALVASAYLLTGDHGLAQDLVQAALVRTWPHWDRISAGSPEAYVRQVMVRLQSSWFRRKWRGEVPTETLPEGAVRSDSARADLAGGVDERLVLAGALARLPLGQRQVLVLRYVDDLSVEQVAHILGCSSGTVKSQTARGLARLRAILADSERVEERL